MEILSEIGWTKIIVRRTDSRKKCLNQRAAACSLFFFLCVCVCVRVFIHPSRRRNGEISRFISEEKRKNNRVIHQRSNELGFQSIPRRSFTISNVDNREAAPYLRSSSFRPSIENTRRNDRKYRARAREHNKELWWIHGEVFAIPRANRIWFRAARGERQLLIRSPAVQFAAFKASKAYTLYLVSWKGERKKGKKLGGRE